MRRLGYKAIEDSGIIVRNKKLGYRLGKRNGSSEKILELCQQGKRGRYISSKGAGEHDFLCLGGARRWKVLLEYFEEELAYELAVTATIASNSGHCSLPGQTRVQTSLKKR